MDWLATLAELRIATLARDGLDARDETAREVREVTDAARRGEPDAREWIESPAWDIAHEILGWRSFAALHRRIALAPQVVGDPTSAEVLASAALLAAAYEAAGCSARRCGARLGVSDITVRRAAVRLGVELRHAGRPVHQEAA